MKQLFVYLSAVILFTGFSSADSLVPPNFSGYLNTGGSLKPGTVLQVSIDSSTKFIYSASYSDNTAVSLEFTGGEGEGLFNFLPSGNTRNEINATGEDESSMQGLLSVRVTEIDGNGGFFLRGGREIRVGKAGQRLEIEGWGSLSLMDDEGRIPFDSLADAVLTFTSFTESSLPVLTGDNFAVSETTPVPELITPEGTPVVPETAPETAGPVPAENAAGNSGPGGLKLKDEVRRDLLLQYINQMIDLIFAAPK